MPPRRIWPFFLLTLCLPFAWSQERILYLKGGDALEGTLVGETETAATLRLHNGVVVSIDRDRIESIETPESISALQEEFRREALESAEDHGEIDLRDVFQTVNPTPTPIPIRRLEPLQVRKKFKATEYRASLLPKGLDPEVREPIRALPMIPEQDEEGNRNFGVVTHLEDGPKVRRGGGSWEPLERDLLLNPGDEINTLEGRLEITTQRGNLIRLEANTELFLERSKAILSRGRAWLQTFSRHYTAVDVGNLTARLQPNGLAQIETLRSGNKFTLIEGEMRFNNLPETPRLLRSLPGPATVWVDGANTLVSEEGVEPVQIARWEEWQRSIAEAVSPAFSGDFTPGSIPTEVQAEQTKNLLLSIAEALTNHHLDLGVFPPQLDSASNLESLFKDNGASGWRGPYLTEVPFPPLDPYGNELIYRVFTPEGEIGVIAGIYSKGPNNEFEDGEGDDVGVLIPEPIPEVD